MVEAGLLKQGWQAPVVLLERGTALPPARVLRAAVNMNSHDELVMAA